MKRGYDNMTEQEMLNYYKKERQAREYALDFYNRIKGIYEYYLLEDALPIVFRDATEEDYSLALAGATHLEDTTDFKGKQAVIRIRLNHNSEYLEYPVKSVIRHEIVHYALWASDYPSEDDSLHFWCAAYAYKANPYAELDYDDELKFEVFKKICDERFLPYIHTNAMAVILLEVFEHTSDSLADFEKALEAIADSADARYSDRFKNYKILKIELDIQDNQDDELEILYLLDDFFDEIEYYYSLEMNESGKALLTVTSYGNIDFEKLENELKAYY